MDRQPQPELALGNQAGWQLGHGHSLTAAVAAFPIFGADRFSNDQLGWLVVVFGRDFLPNPRSFFAAERAELIFRFQDHRLLLQLDGRHMATAALLRSFLLAGALFLHLF